MSFVDEFARLNIERLARAGGDFPLDSAKDPGVGIGLEEFAALLAPATPEHLELLCRRAQVLTQQRFGKVLRLFAPLYLSNECINHCAYCGFSRDNPILRVTLSVDEVVAEARALAAQGFRSLLLVAGEHPKFIPLEYIADCVRAVRKIVPQVSLEIGPCDQPAYELLVEAGAEGLVVYQETYDPVVYARVHTAGPKRDFNWRLETPERACAAGFRRIGIGALFGLADWRGEAIRLAAHAQYLLKHYWKTQLTISLPRLRPCAGDFDPPCPLPDREMVQLVAALRLFAPDAGLVLSTREARRFRDGLVPLGITHASAGSHTEPGGYTGAGRAKLHRTERGRIVPLTAGSSEWSPDLADIQATAQFEIADDRSPSEFASGIRRLGYEPVWKDWDVALGSGDGGVVPSL